MTSTQTRAGALAFAVFALVLAGLWLSLPRIDPGHPTDAAADVVRPSQSRRGKKLTQPPLPPAAPAVASPLPVTVTVKIGSWRAQQYDPLTGRAGTPVAGTAYRIQPSVGWPDPTEAPLPDHPVTDEVLARIEGDGYDPERLIALAEDAGAVASAPDILDRPWDALVALEVENARAELAQQRAQAAFDAEYGLPDPEEDPKAYWDARRALDLPGPKADLGPTLTLAQDLMARYPDEPIADYARLYEIDAVGHFRSALFDSDLLAEAAMRTIATTEDPLVLNAAAHMLSNGGEGVDLGADELDRLGAIADRPDAPIPHRQLTNLALVSALENGDLDRAAVWSERNDRELSTFCRYSLSMRRACAIWREQQDAAAAYIAAERDLTPANWRAAIATVARQCGKDASIPEPALTGEAVWSGRWRFSSWSVESGVGTCIEAAEVKGPRPPEGQALVLNLLGP